MVVVNTDAVGNEFAVMVVLKTASATSGAMMHSWQFKNLTFLAIAEFGTRGMEQHCVST